MLESLPGMISPADFISLPYTPDMTPAGIAYACQSLPNIAGRDPKEIFQHMRRIVADQAAELAFRRHLSTINLPYTLNMGGTFTLPGRASTVIGGRNCCLYNSKIFKRSRIHQIHQDLTCLLSSQAWIPSEDLFFENRSETDLLIFSFVTGLVAPDQSQITKAKAAGKTDYLIYTMPAAWSQPSGWTSVGKITLKSESTENLTLTLGGTTENRTWCVEEVNLPPLQRVHVPITFHSLAYVHISESPGGRLGLHSQELDNTMLIYPSQWGNIWVYGMRIILAGWITRGEFRRCARHYHPTLHARELKEGSGQYQAVPFSTLRPLEDLFTRASSWKSNRAF